MLLSILLWCWQKKNEVGIQKMYLERQFTLESFDNSPKNSQWFTKNSVKYLYSFRRSLIVQYLAWQIFLLWTSVCEDLGNSFAVKKFDEVLDKAKIYKWCTADVMLSRRIYNCPIYSHIMILLGIPLRDQLSVLWLDVATYFPHCLVVFLRLYNTQNSVQMALDESKGWLEFV